MLKFPYSYNFEEKKKPNIKWENMVSMNVKGAQINTQKIQKKCRH